MDRLRTFWASLVAVTLALLVSAGGFALLPAPTGPAAASIGAAPAPSAILTTATASTALSGWWKVPVVGPAPVNRTEGQMAWDSEDQEVLLEGGCADYALFGCGRPLSDVWTYAHGSWTNVTAAGAPPGRSGGVLADDPHDGYVVLFGGEGANGTLNDTWTFSGGPWTQLAVSPSPPPLKDAAMAYDPSLSALVLVGGVLAVAATDSNYTWTFQGGAWANISAPTHPTGWISPFAAAQSATGGVVEYGGVTALFFPTYDQQTWTLTGDAWKEASASTSQPGARFGAQGGFVPAWNETIQFGGGGGASIYHDLWTYTPSGGWSQVGGLQQPTGAFYSTQGAWDGADGYFLSFSQVGVGSFYGLPTINGVFNSTWALTTAVSLNVTVPGPSGILRGTTSNFTATAGGGAGPYAFNWSFGDGNWSNGSSSTNHSYARAGTYNGSLTATDSLGQSRSVPFQVTVNNPSSSPIGALLGSGSSLMWVIGVVVVAVGAVAAGILLLRRRQRPPAAAPPAEPVPVAPAEPETTPIT